jgi:hypothetical protein
MNGSNVDQPTGRLSKYVAPALIALSENTYLSAIRAGMVSIVPLTIIGGLFMIVSNFPITWGSPALATVDITNLNDLANRLAQPTDDVSLYIKRSLSSQTTRSLDQYQVSSSSHAPLELELRNELNAIIEGSSVYDEARFSRVALRDVTHKLLERQPQGKDLARLNRFCLRMPTRWK